MAHDPSSLVGRRIGPYRIVSLLGAGGMGEVYRASDESLGREVAIKILPHSFSGDADRLARFKREARVLAALNHPNIGVIYGYEEEDDIRALILELIEGPTLADHIDSGRLETTDALTIGFQIAEALEAAHEKGVIHRDLKPANIKLTSNGRVKVLDFGLAKTFAVSPAADSNVVTATAEVTQPGRILGTTIYMSPEQARGGNVDKRTDIWAFGCVLYEMLTGRTPFGARSLSEIFAAILEREPTWDALPANTPPRVRQLLERCLEKNPRHRLRDIGDARLELNDVLRGTPAHEPSRAWHARGRYVITATAALAVAVAGIWLGFFREHTAPSTVAERRLRDGNRPSLNEEANTYYERALVFGGIGSANPDKARQMIERALQLDSTFAAARAEYAFSDVVAIVNGRSNDANLFYKAETEVRHALRDDPRCGRAHSVLALIYLLQGRKELVPKEVDQALKDNPSDATAHSWLLDYHRLNGDYDKAREQAEWLVREWKVFWPGHLQFGELLREQGDTAGAVQRHEQVLEQDSQNVDALAALTRAYIDAADLQKARQTLNRANSAQRQNYALRQQRAILLALEHRTREAVQGDGRRPGDICRDADLRSRVRRGSLCRYG
jgi:Tfp pilus assembly protein PilF